MQVAKKIEISDQCGLVFDGNLLPFYLSEAGVRIDYRGPSGAPVEVTVTFLADSVEIDPMFHIEQDGDVATVTYVPESVCA